MKNNNQEIKLYFDSIVDDDFRNIVLYEYYYCTFNLRGEFILYGKAHDYYSGGKIQIVWIYSTETINKRWECKKIYKILDDFELISISKYDKLYLFSKDCIYGWDIPTEKSIKIFGFETDKVIKLLNSFVKN